MPTWLTKQEAQLSQRDRACFVSLDISPSHPRSLKTVPFESLDMVSYSHYVTTMAVSLAVFEILQTMTIP